MEAGSGFQDRDWRWERVRKLMADRGVDVLIVMPPNVSSGNLYYHFTPGDALYLANEWGAVIFPLEGDPTLIRGRASDEPGVWIQDVRFRTPRGGSRSQYGEQVAARLREMEADGKRIAIAGLSQGVYAWVRQPEGYVLQVAMTSVREAVPHADLVDAGSIMEEARYIKSEEEIEAIRSGVQIGEASAVAMAEHARPGVTQADVYAHMVFEQVRRGGDPHIAWSGGPWGKPGKRFESAPTGVIEDGWCITNEIGPGYKGYWSQICQPVIVGSVPPLAQDLFDLGKIAFEKSLELMRPGTSWGEIIDGVEALGKGTKYEVGFLLHGRGLGDDGPLVVPGYAYDELKNETVRANTMFILKPHASVPGEGRKYGVTWGDCVVVREGGAERLGTRPMELVSVS